MSNARTELRWTYTPTDYFESATTVTLADGTAVIDNGLVVLTLAAGIVPSQSELDRLSEHVRIAFALRRLLVARRFELSADPNLVAVDEQGKVHRRLFARAGAYGISGVSADFRTTNASGEVITDTKRDRIMQHSVFVQDLTPKILRSVTLRLMFQGLVGAMDDPANELVYLYEVRDAAAKHFQKATLAQKALGLSKSDWSRLGGLANDLPLKEGRHRGRMAGSLRNATETELGEARGIARYVVESFASRHA